MNDSCGEADLGALLALLRPSLSGTMFAFATARASRSIPAGVDVGGTFLEDEGLTIIAPAEQLARTGLDHSGPFAKISLKVHSSLAAVGLTAAITTALTKEGISANVVAGYFHDHVFVPWELRHRALQVLLELAAAAA